jgi:DNA-binding transcriptional MerR regulator
LDKSPDAFRTISEVADHLDTPAHVLRFWESRFPQIRPVKRAGGRRYYRPSDISLLKGIRHLLHDEGMTIRGVQKVLREHGVRYVAALTGGDYVAEEAAEPPPPPAPVAAEVVDLAAARALAAAEADIAAATEGSRAGPFDDEAGFEAGADPAAATGMSRSGPFDDEGGTAAQPDQPPEAPTAAAVEDLPLFAAPPAPPAPPPSAAEPPPEPAQTLAAALRAMPQAALRSRGARARDAIRRLADLRERMAERGRVPRR